MKGSAGIILAAATAAVGTLSVGAVTTHHERGKHRQTDRQRLFQKLDPDGITQAEIGRAHSRRLAEYDADGSGGLNQADFEVMWSARSKERAASMFPRRGKGGNGETSGDEKARGNGAIIERLDGGGAIMREELAQHQRAADWPAR